LRRPAERDGEEEQSQDASYSGVGFGCSRTEAEAGRRASMRDTMANAMHARLVFWSVIAAFALAACGSSDDATSAGHGGSGAATSAGVGASFGAGGNFGAGGGFGSSSGGQSSGSEVCDGIDNDGDGIIDNVDVGNDGVCDCLRIATLGVIGMWGQGDVFTSWLDGKSDKGAVDLNDQVLTKALLDQFEVVVAQDLSKMNRSYAPAEVMALSDWVNAGGGFMTLIGYADPSELANANLLLGAFGMSYGSQQILQKQGGSTVPVTEWVPHPVTMGITLLGVDNGYPVQGAGTALAMEQGFEVLRAQEVGMGHVLMWGDEWITYDSEWNTHPEYQVEEFWLNAIKWLTPTKDCQVPLPPPK
jgi:hypothetical protein